MMRKHLARIIGVVALAAAAALGIAVAFVHEDLEATRLKIASFCFREATFARSHRLDFQIAVSKAQRERLAKNVLDRFKTGSILELCAPGVVIDSSTEEACWKANDDPNCMATFIAQVDLALRDW
jgi:hypothetical protein